MTYQMMVYNSNQHSSVPDSKLEFADWTSFKQWFIDRSKVFVKCKSDNIHLSPAYTEGNRRKQDIKYISKWIALDIDDCKYDLKELIQKVQQLNYKFMIYNSPSCRLNDLRCRIILPLDRKIQPNEYKHFWTNLRRLFWNLIDRQTKDTTRTNGAPGTFKDAQNFMLYSDNGEEVNVDQIKQLYRYVIESPHIDAMRDSYSKLNSRKNTFSKKLSTHQWTSYKDCKYVNQALVSNYHSVCDKDGNDRYIMFYSIMTSIAVRAFKMGNMDFSDKDLIRLMEQIDINDLYTNRPTGNRPLDIEAKNAIKFALKNI